MTANISRRVFLSVLGVTPAAAAGFWQKKKFPSWSQKEVRRMLTDSPWAKTRTVPLAVEGKLERNPETWRELGIPGSGLDEPGMGIGQPGHSPVGGIGAPRSVIASNADLLVRWSSALPVRQALVMHRLGPQQTSSAEAKQILEPDEADYVVEVFGLPAIAAHRGAQLLQREIYRTAWLRTKTGRVLRAGSVYAPIEGLHVAITIRFPRKVPIVLEDKYIDCHADAGVFVFTRRFNLGPMVYQGALDL